MVHVFRLILIEYTPEHHIQSHPQPQNKPYMYIWVALMPTRKPESCKCIGIHEIA